MKELEEKVRAYGKGISENFVAADEAADNAE